MPLARCFTGGATGGDSGPFPGNRSCALGKARRFGIRDVQRFRANRRNHQNIAEAPVSNPESFIDEVNEELKRDKLFAFMRKWAWVAVLVVLLLVGGAAWNEWRKAQESARAQAFGDAVIAALNNPDPAARIAALQGIAADGDQRGVLNLLLAASELQAGDREAALRALAGVEADTTLPESFRQIAALKRVIVGGAAIPAAEREQILNTLAAPGQAFRPLALEQLALLALENGDREGAMQRARALMQEPDLTDALRRRVAQLIVLLGGDPTTSLG